jgi:hypothetical protein
MSELRLAKLDAARVIVRCFYGTEKDFADPAVVPADAPWAVEGVNYDEAKAAYVAQRDEADALVRSYTVEDTNAMITQLRTATPAQVRAFAANSPQLSSFSVAQRAVIGELLVAIGFALRRRF